MEEIMNSRDCKEWSSRPATLTLREGSHGISKPRPKVRIVHIFAPEIIKTDAANFRELVQRLTGQPTKRSGTKKAAGPTVAGAPKPVPRCKRVEAVESQRAHWGSWRADRIKGEGLDRVDEGEMWLEENSGDGFFGGLEDVDGFLQGLGEFPLLPLNSTHMDVMGEAHVS